MTVNNSLMDNNIVSVARLLFGILKGEKLRAAGHRSLLKYFSAYTALVLPPLDSTAFEALMDGITRLMRYWD